MLLGTKKDFSVLDFFATMIIVGFSIVSTVLTYEISRMGVSAKRKATTINFSVVRYRG